MVKEKAALFSTVLFSSEIRSEEINTNETQGGVHGSVRGQARGTHPTRSLTLELGLPCRVGTSKVTAHTQAPLTLLLPLGQRELLQEGPWTGRLLAREGDPSLLASCLPPVPRAVSSPRLQGCTRGPQGIQTHTPHATGGDYNAESKVTCSGPTAINSKPRKGPSTPTLTDIQTRRFLREIQGSQSPPLWAPTVLQESGHPKA